MRFHENGPIIPDLLLEQRDAGRVVFFCGAGVSLSAGMPTFLGLTKHVVDSLDPPEDSDIMKAFGPWLDETAVADTPLDQIFTLLQREYPCEEVNGLVTERLSMPAAASAAPTEHGLISRISTDRHGNPQIVTTNFDLLFERASRNAIISTCSRLCLICPWACRSPGSPICMADWQRKPGVIIPTS